MATPFRHETESNGKQVHCNVEDRGTPQNYSHVESPLLYDFTNALMSEVIGQEQRPRENPYFKPGPLKIAKKNFFRLNLGSSPI